MYAHIESVITQGSLHLEYNIWCMNVHYNVFHKCFFSATKSSGVISGKLFDYIMPQLEIVYHLRKSQKKGLISGLVKGLHLYQNISNTCSNYDSNTANWRFFIRIFCMLTLSLTYTCCNNALLPSILMPLWCLRSRTVPYPWIDMSFIKVNDLSHIFIVGLPKNGRFPTEFFSESHFLIVSL